MLSFRSIKMGGWLGLGAKLVVTVGAKMVVNAAVPGASAVVDFVQAAYDLSQGDIAGAAINIASGVGEIVTCGAAGSIKEVMKGSAKTAAVSTAKETAKQAEKAATKKVGQEFAKRLATGMVQGSKEAAIQSAKQTAKAAGKEATKKVGQQLSKEFVKGALNEAVEEAWRQGTKTTLKSFGHKTATVIISSGGSQVMKTCGEAVFEESVKALLELPKQTAKTHVFKLTTEAAKTAAGKEFVKNSSKLLGIEYGSAVVKGGMRAVTPYFK